MTTLVDRHDGDLDGRLLGSEARRPVEVELVLESGTADRHAVQHTTWMLANLLARLERRVVRRVSIVAPEGVPLRQNVIPGSVPGADFADAIASRLSMLDRSPVERGALHPDVRLVIAPGPAATGVMRVLGEGWGGGVTRNALDARLVSSTPIGPYVAAAMAAGEVFKLATLPHPAPLPEALFYSAWDFQASPQPPITVDPSLEGVFLRSTLAGVGAVGTALVHALWAYTALRGEIVLVDNDEKGVDSTNLGRYVLFFPASLGHAKATAAATIAARDGLLWVPFDQDIEVVTPRKEEFVLSAVDTDRARAAIQLRYPACLLGASTSGLRAELLRAGPAGRGSCLACAGVFEPDSDEVVRARLSSANQALIEKGLAPNEIESVKAGNVRCGEIEARVLRAQRHVETAADGVEGQFAVSFVSLMAGTMLAAAALKEALQVRAPVHDEENRAVHQFFNGLASSNRVSFVARRPGCSYCDPSSPAAGIWTGRQAAWSSGSR